MTSAQRDEACSPLGAVVDRLDGMADYLTCRLGVPDQTEWVRLAHLDDEAIGNWFTKAMARLADRPAAALDVGAKIGQAAVLAWMVPVVATRRLPLLELDEVAVRRDGDGHLDGVGWTEGKVAALPDDPAAGEPGVIPVAGWGEMLDLVADRIMGIDPLFETLRRVARIGRPALWGSVADLVAGYALWTARTLDLDRQRQWASAQEIIDRLTDRQPQLRARPKPFPVAYSRGEELFQVRGTCCLWYRSCSEPDPDGDGYCNTCPLRTDQSRTERLRRYLEEEIVGS